MIEYYEQLSQEEQEAITEVIQTLYRQTFILERNLKSDPEECSIHGNIGSAVSIWNF